jgi:hypothetical protein
MRAAVQAVSTLSAELGSFGVDPVIPLEAEAYTPGASLVTSYGFGSTFPSKQIEIGGSVLFYQDTLTTGRLTADIRLAPTLVTVPGIISSVKAGGLLVGANATQHVTSVDGVVWVDRGAHGLSNPTIQYANGVYYVFDAGVSSAAKTSTDGITWSTQTFNASVLNYKLSHIQYVNGYYFTTYTNGSFYRFGVGVAPNDHTECVLSTIRTVEVMFVAGRYIAFTALSASNWTLLGSNPYDLANWGSFSLPKELSFPLLVKDGYYHSVDGSGLLSYSVNAYDWREGTGGTGLITHYTSWVIDKRTGAYITGGFTPSLITVGRYPVAYGTLTDVDLGLRGSAVGESVAVAELGYTLQAFPKAVATATADLSIFIALNAAVSCESSALLISPDDNIAAAVSCESEAFGDLTVGAGLQAVVACESTATAVLYVGLRAVEAFAESLATAKLTVNNLPFPTLAMKSQASASAGISTEILLNANAPAQFSASMPVLRTGQGLFASNESASIATGSLHAKISLSAIAACESAAVSDLLANIEFAAEAKAVCAALGKFYVDPLHVALFATSKDERSIVTRRENRTEVFSLKQCTLAHVSERSERVFCNPNTSED